MFFLLILVTHSQVHYLLKFWILWSDIQNLFHEQPSILVSFILHMFTSDSQFVICCQRKSQILGYRIPYKFRIFHLHFCIDSCSVILSFTFYGFLTALSTTAIPKLFHTPLNNLCKLLDLKYFPLCYLLTETPFYSGSKMLSPRIKIVIILSQSC